METNIAPQAAGAPQMQQYLPPPPAGASVIESTIPQQQVVAAAAPPVTQQSLAPRMESPSEFFSSVNWLEVVVYASVLTFIFIGANYYRNQNKLVNTELTKQSDRITALETEVTALTPVHQ